MKIFLFFFLLLYILPGIKDRGANSPSGLMVEFIREPEKVKILDLKPEFTWIIPLKAKVQTSCQILVASTIEKLQMNTGDIWNSQRVMSQVSSEVEYGGSGLSANTIYFWKVRIWNSRKKPSEYSAIQSFTTGDPDGYATTVNRFISTLIKPEKLIKIADNHYFIDFGKDAFGTLFLEINPVEKDTIIVHLGEKTSGENMIDKNPGGSIRYQKVLLPLTKGITKYTLKLPPDARNTGSAAVHLPDSFGVVTPFRYCELENCHYDLSKDNISQKSYNYYFDDECKQFHEFGYNT